MVRTMLCSGLLRGWLFVRSEPQLISAEGLIVQDLGDVNYNGVRAYGPYNCMYVVRDRQAVLHARAHFLHRQDTEIFDYRDPSNARARSPDLTIEWMRRYVQIPHKNCLYAVRVVEVAVKRLCEGTRVAPPNHTGEGLSS